MISSSDLQALLITFALAAITVICLFVVGMPLAWWLGRSRGGWKAVLEALIALPLVLPPTVLGFYLLLLLGSQGPLVSSGFAQLAFTFPGLVIGSMIYSLPFVVQPLISSFQGVSRDQLEAAEANGANAWRRFWSVAVPASTSGIITASVLGFAHTMGEFGVVLMLGGSIPGSTRVASIAIYEHVEGLDYGAAHKLAALMLGISLLLLIPIYVVDRKRRMSE